MNSVEQKLCPTQLKPHFRNQSIYGDEDISSLAELIRQSGWIKPLVATPNYVIISGHRRWKAALFLGLDSIPVEVREFTDHTDELEALLLENASRFKTTEQKVREAEAWKEVEAKKARQRMSLAAKSSRQGVENFPHLAKGKTRDAIANRVGLGSGRTYDKASAVVRQIDTLYEDTPVAAKALRKVLNEQSVDAAHQLLKKPNEQRQQILDLISENKAKNTTQALKILRLREDAVEKSDSQFNASDLPLELRSCWNCQHRGELIENHSFYCNRKGSVSLLENSARVIGSECNLWRQELSNLESSHDKPQHPKSETFTLTLPTYLQLLINSAASAKGISVEDWTTTVLELAAIAAMQHPNQVVQAE